MQERALDHESRLSRIEALLEALNKRLDDAILTQLRDHGKRIRELEDHIAAMAETCARERGQQAGSRAMLVFIMTVISSLGGCIGAVVGRQF